MDYKGAENVRSLLQEQYELIDSLLYENNLQTKTINEQLSQIEEQDKIVEGLTQQLEEIQESFKAENAVAANCNFCQPDSIIEIGETAIFNKNNKLILEAYTPMGWKRRYDLNFKFCPWCGRSLV